MEKIYYEITGRKQETYKEFNRETAMEAYSAKKFHVVEVKQMMTYTANAVVVVTISTHIKSFKDFS